jgi:hypothetical protein
LNQVVQKLRLSSFVKDVCKAKLRFHCWLFSSSASLIGLFIKLRSAAPPGVASLSAGLWLKDRVKQA